MGEQESGTSTSRLQAIGRRLRAAMNASAAGPALVAAEIVQISSSWEDYRAEAEGLDCTSWIAKHVTHRGKGLAWFVQLDAAVQIVGRAQAARLEYRAVLWTARQVPEPYRFGVLSGVNKMYRENNSSCVTLAQVKRVAAETMQTVSQPKTCGRCQRLEEQIRQLGAEPAE